MDHEAAAVLDREDVTVSKTNGPAAECILSAGPKRSNIAAHNTGWLKKHYEKLNLI